MADQNSQTGKQQSEQKQSNITKNRTRQEKTQNTDSADTGQDASQEQGGQPKFQSKHKDRSVQPPEKPQKNDTSNTTGSDDTEAAPHAPGSVSAPQGQAQTGSQSQPTQAEEASGEDAEQSTDPGGASSKLETEPQSTDQGADGDGSVLPPKSHLDSLGDKKEEKPSKSNKSTWLVVLVAVVLLVFGLGGYAAYAQYVAPKRAPVSYLQRLSEMESGNYKIQATSTSDQAEMGVDAEGKFTQSADDSELPELSTSAKVNYDIGTVNVELDFDFRLLDNTTYVRLNNAGLLASFLPGLEADTWYHHDIDEEEKERFVGSQKCSEEDLEKLEDYFENEAPDAMEITNPQRHDWFGEDRNGHRMRHFSGEVAGETIQGTLEGAASATSETCMASIKDSKDTLEDLNLKYDLYVGDDRDEAVVRFFEEDEEKGKMTLITSGYNTEVDISAPQDSQPLQDLFPQGSPGFNMNSNSNFGSPGNTRDSRNFSQDSNPLESNLQ